MKVKTAQSKIRSTRGSSFLTHGSDNYDHKGLKKARRALDQAIIEEELVDDVPTAKVNMKWVVEAFRCDGDKWWLDGYEVVLVTDSYEDANNMCIEEDLMYNLTTNGDPAPKSHLKYIDVTNDVEAQFWLERLEMWKQFNRNWSSYSI